jgi:hypothetical protein
MNIDSRKNWHLQAMQHGYETALSSSDVLTPDTGETADMYPSLLELYRGTLTVDGDPAAQHFGPGIIGTIVADFLYGYAFGMGEHCGVLKVQP